ncbi:MAG: T9SS type A sorting domain-containing protein [Clostridia bacterium]|nr:T9SS type A sorting domain-containing protein [Clostridia bacterium]
MKNFLLGFLMLTMGGLLNISNAQTDVTFQVDLGTLTPNPNGISVAGDFQNEAGYPSDWAPGATMMTQVDASSVYAITVQLPAGTYSFKYINGVNWGDDESVPGGCSFGGNRQVIVGEDALVLDPVCFGSCTVCNPPEVEVTFQVNMAEQTVSGDGVFIAGNFQGWNAGGTAMTLDHDAIYTYTASLPVGDFVMYKFLNGTSGWENVPGSCNWDGNRFLTVPAVATTLDPVCWGSCLDCEVPRVEITFQVDMSNETISPDGIHIAGSFQNPAWQPGATPMTDQGNGIYSYTANLPVGEFIEYKFVNGNSWDDPQPEQVPEECASNGNRYFTVPDVATTFEVVCFGSCGSCEVTGATDLFYSEYYEGSYGNNKYVEIYNGTGAAVDLSNYQVHRISNGGNWEEFTEILSGTLADGDVYVIANSQSIPEILAETDLTSDLTFFNGDDAVGLSKLVGETWQLIDVIGTDGPDPGSGWNVAGVTNATANHTLIRKADVCSPNADWASSAGTDAANSEWIVMNADDYSNIGMHTANCGGSATPVAAMPVFSMPSGMYFESFDVALTSETPSAEIYYTTDGSDPDDNATLYTAPIPVTATITIKAIAYAEDFDPSNISTANYEILPVIEVENLAALRAAYFDGVTDYFRVTGEVVLTFQQTFRSQKFIEDATAGVLIDDPSGKFTTNYDIYDGITGIVGTLSEYGGMIQFTPAKDPGAATSTANIIIPQVITLDDLATNFDDYESELVEIKGVTFADGGATFANGQEYGISDATESANFRTTFYDVDYIGTTIPTEVADVTGIPNSRPNGEFFTSRNLADIVVPDYLLLTAPNGGEEIEQGSEFTITWESNLTETTVDIYLNLVTHEILLAEDIDIEQGWFVWDVTQPVGSNYTIILRTAENLPNDGSDDFFAIVPPFDIKITEIMYNPPENGQDMLEYIEIYNNGNSSVNLNGWSFTAGVNFVFPDIILAPGEYSVSCVNTAAFALVFGFEAPQWISGGLSNGGEKITLSDNLANIRAEVTFDDGGLWPVEPDGYGPSLTFCDASIDNNDPAYWSASTKFAGLNGDGDAVYGTPGAGCNEAEVLPMLYSGGWSGISSNLEPGKISMEELFAPINNNLVILLGKSGLYWPEFAINTIGEWNTHEGYKIKLTEQTYFVFEGAELADKTYMFEPGLAFVPVLSSEPVNVADVIVPLGSAVEFMFDIKTGAVYWPAGGIIPGVEGALEVLVPGYAYLTRFTQSGAIDFDINLPKSSVAAFIKPINTTTWNNVTATGDQHILSISQQALAMLQAGDVIGMFDGSGLCTGMAIYNGAETVLPLVVYGDDNTTDAIDGMTEGQPMQCRIFRSGASENVSVVYNPAFANADGLFATNGLSVIDGFKFGATGINTSESSAVIYPNPSTGIINVATDEPCAVTVTNAHGQIVLQTTMTNHATLNLKQQPKGVYFVTLTNAEQTTTNKVVIK